MKYYSTLLFIVFPMIGIMVMGLLMVQLRSEMKMMHNLTYNDCRNLITEAKETLSQVKIAGSQPLIFGNLEVSRNELDQIDSKATSTEQRLLELEKNLKISVNEALRIPMLEQEIKNLTKASERRNEEFEQNIDQIQNLGLVIVTVFLSLIPIGLIVARFDKRKD